MFRLLITSALMFLIGYWVFSFLTRVFRGGNRQNQRPANNQQSNTAEQEDKHFSKDIGEYVSYEEVKDEDKKE